jgi:O-antigen/teichoic acid export membrane protein
MTSRMLAAPASLWAALVSRGHGGTLLRGTAGSFAVRIAANALLFASQILFARYLGVDGFGLYVLALAWLAVLVLFGRIGFDLATVRFVASYAYARDWGLLRGFLMVSGVTVLICSTVIAGLFATGLPVVVADGSAVAHDALRLAAMATPIVALAQIRAAALRGTGRVALGDVPYSVGQPILLILFFLAAVTLLELPARADVAMAAYCAASAGALAWLWPLLHTQLPAEARTARREFRWREWLTTAPAMVLIAGFAVVLNQSTVIMLGAFSGIAEAGLFGAASRLAAILQIVTFSLVGAIAPMISRLYASGDRTGLQTAIDTGTRAVFGLALAVALAIAVLALPLLSLFGNGFTEGKQTLLILLAGQLVWAATAAAGPVLNMTGHQNVSAAILACAAALHVGLCAILIPVWGVEGAAAATALSIAGSNAAMAFQAQRATGLSGHLRLRRGPGRPGS